MKKNGAKAEIVQGNLLKSEFPINFLCSLFGLSLEVFFIVHIFTMEEKKEMMVQFVFLYSVQCPLLYKCQ